MPAQKPLLSLNNITVRYLTNTLFTDLTFRVNKGELWALVGESGSGKRDLLDTIAGKNNVTRGSVTHHYFQEYVQQLEKHNPLTTFLDLQATVPQKHDFTNLCNVQSFYYQQRYNSYDSEDALTVERHLATIKPAAGVPAFWTLEKVIARFNLTDLRHKHLIKLSNGETKRVLLAAALLKNPRLLLMDNPLMGLDVDARAAFNETLRQIAASGITVIMATSPKEVPDAITHVAVLKKGKLEKTEKREEYEPEQVVFTPPPALPEAELLDLLSYNPPAVYDSVVQMNNVSIKYGDKQVLDGVDWHIRQGERWALLGHNGAGKTTLLSLINGDNPQSYAKKIALFGRKRGSGESIWDIRRRIGFVSPELFQYFPKGSTCHEVVESGMYDTLGLFRQSEQANAAIALRWMRLLEIDQEAANSFQEVSASTQRRALLARALVKNPALLILDEPCQGLDLHEQLQFRQLLDAICAHSPTTLIYVTHYLEELPQSITNVLHLENGKVV
ncbi:ATP-binding cassette domain-containing protein [Botryobacter ruber]|uniref:ATP-binding cassette domain-containing protein n=1 Tax=Botryobacter ruber TaxID=2171629 RepID=UPI000E09FD2A|nr:ATP-binding cassette domain-containing protein [Botryobacter ruber]